MRASLSLSLTALTALAVLASSSASAQVAFEPPEVYLNPTYQAYSYTGGAVAFAGGNLVVGSQNGPYYGNVHVLSGTTGEVLLALQYGYDNDFGTSVAVVPKAGGGHNLLVGAPSANVYGSVGTVTRAGTALLYDGATGAFVRQFVSPTPQTDSAFGRSLAVVPNASGGYDVLIGAPQEHDAGPAMRDGAAYLFNGATGALIRTFRNPTPADWEGFGFAVAAFGTNVLIGAPNERTVGPYSGRAYLFDVGTGALLRTFAAPAPLGTEEFGNSIVVAGNEVVIGAPGRKVKTGPRNKDWAYFAGEVYVFNGSTGQLLRTIANPHPQSYDEFGWSLSVEGDDLAIGAYQDSEAGDRIGGAYLFSRSSGQRRRTFVSPLPQGSAGFGEFGFAVAVSGGRVLVGEPITDAPGGAFYAGAAHLFDGTTGALVRTFQTRRQGDGFGWKLAAVGANLLVAAPWDDTKAYNGGAAHLFDPGTGLLLRSFYDPTPANYEDFGYAVAALGSKIVVGAPYDGTAGASAGAVYLFDGNTGARLRTLLKPNAAPSDYFGQYVDALGGDVLVGDPNDDTAGFTSAGAVYLFDAATGLPVRTFYHPNPKAYGYFGQAIAAAGGNLVVGVAYDSPNNVTSAGAAYVFDRATGALRFTLQDPTPAVGDAFGTRVAARGNDILVSAPYDDTAGPNAGAVYLFDGTTGALLQVFLPPSAAAYQGFGYYAIAAVGADVLVGNPGYSEPGMPYVGEAYLFDGATGGLLWTFENPTPNGYEQFGSSAAALGNDVVIGSTADNAGGYGSGAVWLFRRIP